LGVTSLLLAGAALSGPQTAAAQELGRITGRAMDAATQAPLSDVQVYLVGANMGSLSRQNGAYVIINVPAGTYELRAERIGLTTLTRSVTLTAGQALEVNFEMSAQALGLDEIVVTGTAGAATRREVGNSVTQINTVDLPDRPTSVMQMLTAMAPGVEVTSTGGSELGQGQEIRIRGINSINNNSSPIIMIDGVRIMSNTFPSAGSSSNNPSALAQINPNDIERIEIISGPAASTIYGTEASAGVVQVFTRRGSQRAPVWTAESQLGTMWNQKFGANGVDYMWMDPWICTGPFKCGFYQAYDNRHAGILPDGPLQQLHTLSVRGGGQSLQYFMSGGLESDRGATPEEELERWNIRGNFTLNPLPDLVVQWNSAYSNSFQHNSPTGNVIGGLTLSVFRGNQNYIATADTAKINSLLEREITQSIERFTTGGTFTYSPLTNFTNRLTIGYDYSFQERRSIQPFGFIQAPQGTISTADYHRRFLTFDYIGTFTLNVTEALRSSLSWGGQAVGDSEVNLSGSGEGFPGAAYPTLNSASTSTSSETRQKVWNSGFFFQNVFDMNQKYFLTLGLRVDGNSTFGKNFNLQMYPKLSGSWVVSDEAFWPRDRFGELKVRGAWGKSGRAPDAFVAQRTWTNGGLGGEPAFVPQNLGNPDIGPEVTTELELGFDAAWFGDRIRPAYTYYHQTTNDAIQETGTIPSLGFTSEVDFNIGKVKNWGHELRMDVTALRTRNWGWDVSTSVARQDNEVIEWEGESNPANEDRIGRPISYSTWNMYVNPEGMGTQRRTDGTYQIQSCYVPAPGVPAGEQGDSVPRPGVDRSIHACQFGSQHIYGYPLSRPTLLVNGTTTVRLPYGIAVSARAEFRGGHGYWRSTNAMGSAVGRNARSPVCLPYYVDDVSNILRTDTPGIWVARCHPSLATGYNHKAGELTLHTISATVPMDFAFPDRVQNATLTLVMGEVKRWNNSLWNNYPPGVSERVPPTTTFRASLRVTF
jgi:outer membrane receptor for ferrienterochelin and colicin